MPYGDIERVGTSGASDETAKQDRLYEKGLRGEAVSHEMARIDLQSMKEYTSIIKRAGEKCDVDPALIAGIISRESRAGKQLDNGWGDYGKAFGLMQVDCTPTGGRHKPEGNWDSLEHLEHGTKSLVEKIHTIRGQFPDWSPNQHLKGAIAAYNCGERRVCSYEHVDANTTGWDYSNDVVARAQWYKRNLRF